MRYRFCPVCPCSAALLQGHFGAGGLLFNIIWLIFFGWGFAIAHLVIGIIFCITIVGIPFGIQHLKFDQLGLIPFGAEIS
ncbi:MAG TPA: hypothetical protein DD730_13575 [Desulfosporosinus sp.]|nr:hypothetical protein [Desulfosporosinus sp.]